MTKTVLATLGLVLTLAACGVDGDPKPPPPKPAADAPITVSGTVEMGVTARG